jgi:hypothetical protein
MIDQSILEKLLFFDFSFKSGLKLRLDRQIASFLPGEYLNIFKIKIKQQQLFQLGNKLQLPKTLVY